MTLGQPGTLIRRLSVRSIGKGGSNAFEGYGAAGRSANGATLNGIEETGRNSKRPTLNSWRTVFAVTLVLVIAAVNGPTLNIQLSTFRNGAWHAIVYP
jgi:hypothetical protein